MLKLKTTRTKKEKERKKSELCEALCHRLETKSSTAGLNRVEQGNDFYL